MNSLFKKEIILSFLILLLLGYFLKPVLMPMSSMMEMAAGTTLVLLFALLAGALLKERAGDERENLHRMLADRFGFLAGAGALTLIAAIQSFRHSVDPWLIGALGIMILAKMVGLLYGSIKK